MRVLVALGKTVECARDLAKDARELADKSLQYKEALARLELSPAEIEELKMMVQQLKSLLELEIADEAGAVACVKGYCFFKNRAQRRAALFNGKAYPALSH